MRVHGRGGAGGGAVATIPFWATGGEDGSNLTASANSLCLTGFSLPASCQFGHIVAHIATADGAHNSDIGVYDSTGTLKANIGAQALAASGVQTFAILQGLITITAGMYFMAFTSAGSILQIWTDSQKLSPFKSGSYGVSVGGALPASITPPTLAVDQVSLNCALIT